MTDSLIDFQKSGLEVVRAIMAGAPPIPMADSLNFRLVEVDKGRVVFEGQPDARFLNPLGTTQGGWAASILDAAMWCAIQSSLEAGQGSATLELKTVYHRPLTPEVGLMRAEGHALSVSRRAGFAEAKLTGPDGRLYTSATSTCIVMDRP